MKKVTISNRKASKIHLAAGVLALLVLLGVRMHAVVALAQALVPTSSMVGQEVFIIMGIVGLWYMIWGCIVLSLILRVCIRLMAMYISK